MTLRVHFSFDYKRDLAAYSALCSQLDPQQFEVLPMLPRDAWRKTVEGGAAGVKAWLERQIGIAQLVVVLVGGLTYTRPLVRLEIAAAVRASKPMFGVYVPGKERGSGLAQNPFSYVTASAVGGKATNHRIYVLPPDGIDGMFARWVAEAISVKAGGARR